MSLSKKTKIVVLTPVRNEAWILDRFLSVTSEFADYIIILDQNSNDKSRNICEKYSKVVLINNNSDKYNEGERQKLLLKAARNIVQGRKLILALDADEIIAANAPYTSDWERMLTSEPGTILYFQKQDLYPTPDNYICYPEFFPLGYMDDGKEHFPKLIHSPRIPTPQNSARLFLNEIKILHYLWTRPNSRLSKNRWYSVQENILGNSSLFNRRYRYKPDINYPITNAKPKKIPVEWFDGWDKCGIDMRTVNDSKYHWQDFDLLRLFKKYGVYRFWFDAIWNFDWETCRINALS